MEIEYHTLEEINARWLARVEELNEAILQGFAALAPLVEEVLERVRLWWEEFCRYWRETLKPFLVYLDEIYEELQRTALYIRLCKAHLPHWLAVPVARYWPRAWLPISPFQPI